MSMIRKRRLAVLVTATVLVLAGCSSPGSTGTSGSSAGDASAWRHSQHAGHR